MSKILKDILLKNAEIISETNVSESGRKIFEYSYKLREI